jgi:5S rRNA maturation endonuclease (ribonuclease M5)
MSIDLKAEILSRLDFRALYAKELGPLKYGRGDQAMARCPFHDDTTPSLSLNLQSGLWQCFGCQAGGDVFSFIQKKYKTDFQGALALLAQEAGINFKGNSQRKSKGRGKAKHQIVQTYDYLDGTGRLVFQVCRTEPKGFFQRRPDGNGGWINNLEGVVLVPYRLPELLKARRVFITEGEKDADALAALGLTATCNPMGAGKWRPDFNRYFAAKEVVILPDNDAPGHSHAQTVARNLHGEAASLKVVELPNLPDKGDVSDWLNAGGTREELLSLAEAAPEWPPAAETEKSGQHDPLAGSEYCIDKGRFCYVRWVGSGEKATKIIVPLCNFTAWATVEIIRDDGLETTREFRIEGILDTGRPLPPAIVKAGEFRLMGWVNRCWGLAANIGVGHSAQDRVRECIQLCSQEAQVRNVFTHSGWRKIDGVWCFLHAGGALHGPAGITVDLGEDLGCYRLPEPGGREAAAASLQLLDLGPLVITATLLSVIYLAPLSDKLKIDFTLWLLGGTGNLKSTIAALFLSHFGLFDRRNLPGQWSSTANALEKRAFVLKDLPFVVDDFAPPHDARRASELEAKAHRLLRAVGNRGGRQRLSGDLTERQTYTPRCLLISTGEFLPTGQSLGARYLVVEVKRQEIDLERLGEAQKSRPLLAQAMSAYISSLASDLEETIDRCHSLFEAYRQAAQSHGHLRVPEMVAWLAVGFELFTNFMVHQGVLDGDAAYDLQKEAWKGFLALGQAHSRRLEGEKPSLKFIHALRELFIQKRVYLKDTRGGCPEGWDDLGWKSQGDPGLAVCIGWADDDRLYLMPDSTYRAVYRAIRDEGGYLGPGKNMILKALGEEGFLEPAENGESTRFKKIGGKSYRVIFMPREKLAL